MKTGRKFLFCQCGLLALALIFSSQGSSLAETHPAKAPASKVPLTRDDFSKLLSHQKVVAERPIFDADTFPKIDFLNKELIAVALGPYTLKIRYFDAAQNEVEKPTAPGRYGAVVTSHFPNGISDVDDITLFKTPAPYKTYKDTYDVAVQYPEAFGLSKEVVQREQWNTQNYFYELIHETAHESDSCAVLVAAMHDFQADPARWHGFNYWRIGDAWWAELNKKLGQSQDYPRLVTLPEDYDKKPGEKWPMILFLHGSGERGTDLSKLKNQGPLGYINKDKGHPLPFIVVSPQCPKKEWWSPEKLSLLVDKIEAKYRVDPKRIYVTGLSMGGYGSFDLAASYPQRFAAIAPVSGGENPEIADRLKTVPTWIFHGSEDPVVPTRYSVDIADKMKQDGADVKLTIYPGVGHEKWDVTYSDPELYAWFLQHSLP